MDNEEALNEVAKQLDKMGDFAQLQTNFKKHRGKVTRIDSMRSTPHNFKDELDNVALVTSVLEMIKAAEFAKETGALSLTVLFNNGKAVHMNVQDFIKI